MKKILLSLAVALGLAFPCYALEYNDSKIANQYPVFGNEDQDEANVGIHKRSFSDVSGKVSKDSLKNKNITDINDPDYVPPAETKQHKKNKKGGAEQQTVEPVRLSGDHVEYENQNGDFIATGKVKISQGTSTLLTSYAFGNMKTGDIYMLEGGTVLEPGNRTTSKWIHYNFNNKTGEMKSIEGKGLKDTFKGPHGIIYPDKIVLDQGGMGTRCKAIKAKPCVSMKAKVIEFYPKEKMVAHEVQVFVKGAHIYSRKVWINEFKEKKSLLIRPSVGWNGSDNGFFVKGEMDESIGPRTSVKAIWTQYSRSGFKPRYELHHSEKDFNISYLNGWDEDEDYWYLKQNNWKVNYVPHYFIKGVPISFSAKYEYGLWRQYDADSQVSGRSRWRREFRYDINHDPIKIFGPDTTLHLGYGRKWLHESKNNEGFGETQVTNIYSATLRQKIDRHMRAWVGYNYEKMNSSMYDLGQPDMEKELRVGLQYQLGDRDTLSIVNRYDISKDKQYQTTYNWYHRFCCWALQFSYEKKWYNHSNEVQLKYFLLNW